VISFCCLGSVAGQCRPRFICCGCGWVWWFAEVCGGVWLWLAWSLSFEWSGFFCHDRLSRSLSDSAALPGGVWLVVDLLLHRYLDCFFSGKAADGRMCVFLVVSCFVYAAVVAWLRVVCC